MVNGRHVGLLCRAHVHCAQSQFWQQKPGEPSPLASLAHRAKMRLKCLTGSSQLAMRPQRLGQAQACHFWLSRVRFSSPLLSLA